MTATGVEPHVEVSGRDDGPLLLLVHGFLSSRAQWRPNLDALERVARVASVELLGHGRSPSPETGGPYTVEGYVAAFDAIRVRLGAARMFVCGQSFGAGLTIGYALRHPDRVLGQVFTNSVSALSPAESLGTDAEREARATALETGGRAAIDALPYHPRNATRAPEDVRAELMRDAALISPRGIAQAMRHTLPRLGVADRLGELQVPSLLVNGLWEKSFQPLRALAAERLPSLEVVDLEGGHSINIENAQGFNAAVEDFIRRHEALR
jgi:pimeloyl-ACP methyl ester carboxylesterase